MTTLVGVVLLILVIVGVLGARYWYQQELKPLSEQSTKISVVIPTGYSTKQIAQLLQDNHVIRSATAFEWYVRNSDSRDNLKAGQYKLDSSLSVTNLVAIIAGGKIEVKLFTVLPGKNVTAIYPGKSTHHILFPSGKCPIILTLKNYSPIGPGIQYC